MNGAERQGVRNVCGVEVGYVGRGLNRYFGIDRMNMVGDWRAVGG